MGVLLFKGQIMLLIYVHIAVLVLGSGTMIGLAEYALYMYGYEVEQY